MIYAFELHEGNTEYNTNNSKQLCGERIVGKFS